MPQLPVWKFTKGPDFSTKTQLMQDTGTRQNCCAEGFTTSERTRGRGRNTERVWWAKMLLSTTCVLVTFQTKKLLKNNAGENDDSDDTDDEDDAQ